MDVGVVVDLVQSREFGLGLVAGGTALLIGVAMQRWRPDWGVLWGVAVLAVLLWADRFDARRIERAFEMRIWVIVAIALIGAIVAVRLYRQRADPSLSLAFAVSLAGMWATLPDASETSVLLGVMALLGWGWWAPHLLTVGRLGVVLMMAGTGWAVFVGGAGRPTAAIGGLGSLLVLALYDTGRLPPWLNLVLHVALVAVWSRWAGLSGTISAGLAIGLGATILATTLKLRAPAPSSQPR